MVVPNALISFLLVVGLAACSQGARPNILYLMSDDMRPELGTYGHPFIKSPNLDALAAKSLQFDFAYTQFAYCAPSRNSFMSGRRPERTRALNFLTTFRQAPGGANWTAMPQRFKNAGYFTSSAGKIYHDGMDDPMSWTYPSNQTKWTQCHTGDMIEPLHNYCGITNESVVPYSDEDLVLAEGLKRLDLAHASGKPWFVGIGVHRPHTEYRVPDGFYGPQLYPGDVVKPPKHPAPPMNAPFMAGNSHDGDINDPAHGCPDCIVPSNRSVEYRRWYYGAITYSDHMLAMALEKIEDMGVADNTIIVFHSDHGYQLGELNEWSKKTDTELAVHVPLIIHVPFKPNSQGKRTVVKAELVDIYKTLVELAEIGEVEDGVQGMSLAPVFDDPEHPTKNFLEKRAYSQIGRCACRFYTEYNVNQCNSNACAGVPLGLFDYMGYTVRTATHRFTAWVSFDNSTMRVDWNRTAGLELYDLTEDDGRNFDFDGYSHNVVYEAGNSDLVEQLFQDLKSTVSTWY